MPRELEIIVPEIFELRATDVFVSYDPSVDGTQDLLTVATTEVTLPSFGVTGTINNLVVRNDGFAFDDAEIEWNATPGNPLRFGSLLELQSLGFGVTDFDLTFGEAFVFTGSLSIFSDAATFLPGQTVEAQISQRPGSTQHGLIATLNFDEEGEIDSLQFHVDQVQVTVGSLLVFTGTDIDIDTGAWGDPDALLVSFGSIGAKLTLGSVTVAGEGRNFGFRGDGSFDALENFTVIVRADALDGAGIGWPSWMPIRITEVGIQWEDIETDPTDFVLVVSAEVVGMHNLPLEFSGVIEGIKIDITKLTNGEFPIIDIASLGASVSGPLFGGELTGTLVGGILKLDADGNVLDSFAPEEDIAERIFFIGVEAGFEFPGVGGLTIRFAVSELGPLGVFINGSVPGGILLEPITGLSMNDFSGGVEFFTSLPDYDDPFQLRDGTFDLPTEMTAAEWLDQIQDQVAAQFASIQANPDQEGFLAAFTEVMTITGGAKLFSIYTSEHVFNGDVIFKFSTDGKFAIQGQLNFAADNLSVSAKLYADLSKVDEGDVTILFLADAPDQAPVTTMFGEFTMEFLDNPVDPDAPLVVLNLEGGMIVQAPLGAVGDITGTGIQDTEIFTIEGGVRLTIDTATPSFIVDVNGTMSMVYLGTIGSAAGQFVLEVPALDEAPKLYGVLRIESGLDKLEQIGIELNADAMLQINTTDEEQNVVISLEGIAGDELAVADDATVLALLEGLSPVLPPLALDAVPTSVHALLIRNDLGIDTDLNAANGEQAIMLAEATTTIEVVITGAKWKVYDSETELSYFLEKTADGKIRIRGEAQSFTLEPETYMVEIRGELIFHVPAFESDGVTPGPDLFVLAGAAYMKINRDGLEAFVVGRVKIGPTGSEFFEFDGQGLLVINDSGIAAGLHLELDISNIPGVAFSGSFGLIINTNERIAGVCNSDSLPNRTAPHTTCDSRRRLAWRPNQRIRNEQHVVLESQCGWYGTCSGPDRSR